MRVNVRTTWTTLTTPDTFFRLLFLLSCVGRLSLANKAYIYRPIARLGRLTGSGRLTYLRDYGLERRRPRTRFGRSTV